MTAESIGAYEAKTHLPQLLDEVAATGRSILIAKRGRPIAKLVAVTPDDEDVATVIAELRAARHGVSRGDDTVRSMIDEGRR
jgi:prevent-host-death family protein